MITVIGSLNYDLVTFTKRVPEAGETIQGDLFEEHLGGKGMNECVAVVSLIHSELRKHIRMWGRVGDDRQGQMFLDKLHSLNVDTSSVKTLPNTRSGSATIMVEELTGENRIIIIGGANSQLRPTEDELRASFPSDSSEKQFVVLQNEFPDPLYVINWLGDNRPNVTTFYNPSPLKKELLKMEILNKVEYLVVNRGEAWGLIGESAKGAQGAQGAQGAEGANDNELVISMLRSFLDKPTLIITLGSKGCIFNQPTMDPKSYHFVPSRKVSNVVDTTGAGDTFLGGTVAELYSGASLKDALNFATAASSLAIQKKGAVEGIPKYANVKNIM
ncbi:hypothetical protein FOA43_000876 [Brettanomyces nanus]|uniref:Ribokinase n=1 Tax=Eeniella nana TaxID=13502 RepID=A0A875S2J2_EENNA|nr:uncharacterized protein FOA43_000876 [Brettanomyces nanus]QPG73564.1 hypothetical protein FOA43_000876 [Brettanomyces nanus]